MCGGLGVVCAFLTTSMLSALSEFEIKFYRVLHVYPYVADHYCLFTWHPSTSLEDLSLALLWILLISEWTIPYSTRADTTKMIQVCNQMFTECHSMLCRSPSTRPTLCVIDAITQSPPRETRAGIDSLSIQKVSQADRTISELGTKISVMNG